MPREPRRVAQSYDELVRRTVPEPDSSFRPTQLQEQQAYEGTRLLSDEEQALHDRVAAALAELPGIDPSTLQIEVDREMVTLHGQIADPSLFDRIEQRMDAVDGVRGVVNQLVVGTADRPPPERPR